MWWTAILSALSSILGKNNPNASNKLNSAGAITNLFKNTGNKTTPK